MLYAVDMDMKKMLGKRISAARKEAPRKLTQGQLAEALGVTPQAISGWERGEAMPDAARLAKLADALGVSLIWLLKDTEPHDISLHYLRELNEVDRRKRGTSAPSSAVAGSPVSKDQLVGARDFPIYAAAQGGDGVMIVHTDVMEYVKRPVILEGVPDSYGVLIVGESMIPAYRPGDMALVHPRRPIERDADVILYDHDPRTGDAKAMIKHLVSFNDRTLRLEQYNPPKTFNEYRADWPICHQVVGMYKGRR